MIVGVVLRNFKTYAGINYIPLTNGQSFCGLLGNNGIGKSSVLEAFDSYFNYREWNFNVITKKSGFATTIPHIVPVYLLPKKSIPDEVQEIAEELSSYAWELNESDVLPQNRSQFATFERQRETLAMEFQKEEYYLLPIGVTFENKISLSFFNTNSLVKIMLESHGESAQKLQGEDLEVFSGLSNYLRSSVDYIYIPKDINPEKFTQLETKEIQFLMGETLHEVVEKCVPQSKIQEINTSLNGFINSLSDVLEDYAFRTDGERQTNLEKADVYKLIVEAYFKIRKLHKKQGSHWLEMAALSSGEKQRAIIELAYHFLKDYRNETKNIILGIDEPEASLHMSACYDQFNRLYEVSQFCRQLIFTTHWYGFIPTIEEGAVSIISKDEKNHYFDLLSVNGYREAIKHFQKRTKGSLPYDIRLKSINDFIQSIVTSILSDEPYNWLICEGSSEKIYFEHYFAEEVKEKKLRIIPVGGAREIKRIYNNLQVAYEDFKSEIKGKVILLIDTDPQLVQFETRDDFENLLCFRMVNVERNRKTELVKISSNPVSPKTEIEDALNGRLFLETLKQFQEDFPELAETIGDIQEVPEEPPFFALDLPPSKNKIIEEFFDKGNNKFLFAEKYVDLAKEASYEVPEWIQHIKKQF